MERSNYVLPANWYYHEICIKRADSTLCVHNFVGTWNEITRSSFTRLDRDRDLIKRGKERERERNEERKKKDEES